MNDMMNLWASMSVRDLKPIYIKDINARPLIEMALNMAMREDDAQLLKAMVIGIEAQEEARDSII